MPTQCCDSYAKHGFDTSYGGACGDCGYTTILDYCNSETSPACGALDDAKKCTYTRIGGANELGCGDGYCRYQYTSDTCGV